MIPSTKEREARTIVEHAVKSYSLATVAACLEWRRLICEVCPQRESDWQKFSTDVHHHWKRYGKSFMKLLIFEFGITAIPVSRKIVKLVKHGDAPNLDDEHRTESHYRECLPSAHAKTFGVVCFPRETCEDHPLIIAALKRRGRSSSSGLVNSLKRIDAAEDSGVISEPVRIGIIDSVLPPVTGAIEAARKQIRFHYH